VLRLTAVAVAIAAAIVLPTSPASGASECATAVLRDWSKDGQVAPKYSPPCYEEAIDALPADLRDYTDAEDVITRALSSSVRSRGATEKPLQSSAAEGDRHAPLIVVALGLLALAVLAAGAASHVARLRRKSARG
jgi:hypothetical protein